VGGGVDEDVAVKVGLEVEGERFGQVEGESADERLEWPN
jgi:hypothetical protein